MTVTVISDEAEAALALLAQRRAGAPLDPEDWHRLFDSDGYHRLRARELGMGRSFTDSAFRAFLLSDSLLQQAGPLERALAAYQKIDVRRAADRAFRYLPPTATIRARLFLTVKPKPNSFVYDFPDGRAIFLYVDPSTAPDVVEHDILSHELHHIGYAAACGKEPEDSSPPARARLWVGAFSEGLAMLAAAGGPNADPHARSSPAQRERWQHDLARWPADFRRIEEFLTSVATGRLADQDSIVALARTFYGEAQGPWYTVGYSMAVLVERALGHDRLVGSICDPLRFLATYNEAARLHNRAHTDQYPLWSDNLLERLGARSGKALPLQVPEPS